MSLGQGTRQFCGLWLSVNSFCVDVLSDAHVRPSGQKVLCITCHPDDRTISHAGRSHVR